MNIFMRSALKFIGPIAINYALRSITPEKIKEWLAEGAEEITAAIGRGFDYLAAKADGTETELDDNALEGARTVVTQGVGAVLESSEVFDLLEKAGEALVALAERTDNELDDTLAKGLLDAIRQAKD